MRLFSAVMRRWSVATLVALGMTGAALAAGVAPALAAPGPIEGLASPSHPDAASWYADPSPSFSWLASLGVAGYAYLIDQAPGTTLSAPVVSPAVRFSSTTLTAGLQPEGIASGDLNGDGKADLVVSDYAASTISVLLGNGNGTFKTHVDYPVGAGAYGIAIADFNGDGKADVAVADWSAATVSVLLGNGDGTLQPAVSYTVGAEPSQIAVGDFNGDGKLDLAVATYAVSAVSVLLGNGDGTFQAATSYADGDQRRGPDRRRLQPRRHTRLGGGGLDRELGQHPAG